MIDPRAIGERLQERRRAQALTQGDIAERLGVSRSNIAALEAGHRQNVGAELLTSLAEAYGISVSDLVRTSFEIPRLSAQFRLAVDTAVEEREGIQASIAQLELLVAKYVQLEAEVGSPLETLPAPDYSSFASVDNAEQIAEAERRRLAIGDGPIEALRDVLERDFGIRSFSIDLPGNVAGLFGQADVAGSCVAFNAAHPATRQRWTLAHELGHILGHRERSEITRLSAYQRKPERERFADAFAGAFLMPRSGIERRLRDLESKDATASVADLLVLANEFGVSSQAMFLRLEDLRYVPAGEWDRLAATRYSLLAVDRQLGLTRRQPDRDRFPRRYVLLAIDAYAAGRLSEGELASFLDTDRLALRQRLEQLSLATIESEHGLEDVEFDLMLPVGVDASIAT